MEHPEGRVIGRWVGRTPPPGCASPCWWLVREILREEYGVDPGDFAAVRREDRAATIQAERAKWEAVEIPTSGDVALIGGREWHAGVVIGRTVVHVQGGSAVAQPLERWLRSPAFAGVFRRRS